MVSRLRVLRFSVGVWLSAFDWLYGEVGVNLLAVLLVFGCLVSVWFGLLDWCVTWLVVSCLCLRLRMVWLLGLVDV